MSWDLRNRFTTCLRSHTDKFNAFTSQDDTSVSYARSQFPMSINPRIFMYVLRQSIFFFIRVKGITVNVHPCFNLIGVGLDENKNRLSWSSHSIFIWVLVSVCHWRGSSLIGGPLILLWILNRQLRIRLYFPLCITNGWCLYIICQHVSNWTLTPPFLSNFS